MSNGGIVNPTTDLSTTLSRSVSTGQADDEGIGAPPGLPKASSTAPKTLRQLSQERKNVDMGYRIAHESDSRAIAKLWDSMSGAEQKKQAVMEHWKVSTQTTRSLSDEDYETLLRIDRAIKKQLNAYDDKDVQFLQRYKDIDKSLPPQEGGVWVLIRRIEQKLAEDVVGNLWQDEMIYGLIGGSEAAIMLKQNHMLLRFSLTECCLCSTQKNTKNQIMHNLYPEGLTESAAQRCGNYTFTTRANPSLMPFSKVYAAYSDPAKKQKRISDYAHWHDQHYGLADVELAVPEGKAAAPESKASDAKAAQVYASLPPGTDSPGAVPVSLAQPVTEIYNGEASKAVIDKFDGSSPFIGNAGSGPSGSSGAEGAVMLDAEGQSPPREQQPVRTLGGLYTIEPSYAKQMAEAKAKQGGGGGGANLYASSLNEIGFSKGNVVKASAGKDNGPGILEGAQEGVDAVPAAGKGPSAQPKPPGTYYSSAPDPFLQ